MWDRWDIVLLLVASYVAVMSLVRLMTSRRNELTAKFRQQFRAEQERQAQEAARARREAIRRGDKVA